MGTVKNFVSKRKIAEVTGNKIWIKLNDFLWKCKMENLVLKPTWGWDDWEQFKKWKHRSWDIDRETAVNSKRRKDNTFKNEQFKKWKHWRDINWHQSPKDRGESDSDRDRNRRIGERPDLPMLPLNNTVVKCHRCRSKNLTKMLKILKKCGKFWPWITQL